MNKGELVDRMAEELGESKASAQRALEAFLKCVVDGVKEHETVTITNFGTFVRKTRAARTVRNPSTGAPIRVKESTTLTFKPSKSVKNHI